MVLAAVLLVGCDSGEEPEQTTFQGGATSPGPGGYDDYGECGPAGAEYDDLQVEFIVHRVFGEDREVSMLGASCLIERQDGWSLELRWGEKDGADWRNLLSLQVPEAGTYDMATDFGEPLSGEVTDAGLSYTFVEGDGAFAHDTANNEGQGALQVNAWPVEATDPIDVHGEGNLGGEDGWVFEFTLTR